MTWLNLILSIIILILIVGYVRMYYEFKIKLSNEIKKAREDSVNKSRSTITGNITESLAPLLPGFPFEGRDCRQLGTPIDYVIFNGMSNYRDNKEGQIEVILCDIKTGNAALTPVEREIKNAVNEGRVKWMTLRFDNEEKQFKEVKHRKIKK